MAKGMTARILPSRSFRNLSGCNITRTGPGFTIDHPWCEITILAQDYPDCWVEITGTVEIGPSRIVDLHHQQDEREMRKIVPSGQNRAGFKPDVKKWD
jgi:hypothetical protein